MKELYQEYDVKMQKTIEVVVSDFAGVRAGRANAAVLDKITVEYYGTETPIQQVASISTPDARTLVIQPCPHAGSDPGDVVMDPHRPHFNPHSPCGE